MWNTVLFVVCTSSTKSTKEFGFIYLIETRFWTKCYLFSYLEKFYQTNFPSWSNNKQYVLMMFMNLLRLLCSMCKVFSTIPYLTPRKILACNWNKNFLEYSFQCKPNLSSLQRFVVLSFCSWKSKLTLQLVHFHF